MHDLGSAPEPDPPGYPAVTQGSTRRLTRKGVTARRETDQRCRKRQTHRIRPGRSHTQTLRHPDPFVIPRRSRGASLVAPRAQPPWLSTIQNQNMDAFAPEIFSPVHFTRITQKFRHFTQICPPTNDDAQNFRPTRSATRSQSRRDFACVARGFDPGWAGPPTRSNSQQYPLGRRS